MGGGGGGSFHQPGTVNENVLESDFEPLCDGTTRRRSLADLRLLDGILQNGAMLTQMRRIVE